MAQPIDLGKVRSLFKEDLIYSTSSISGQKVGSVLQLSKPITNYDYIYIQYESGSGGNFPTQIFKPSIMHTARVTMCSFNLPDSNPNGGYFYEFTMALNSAKNALTIEKINGCKLFDKNETINVGDFGVREVIGIKFD